MWVVIWFLPYFRGQAFTLITECAPRGCSRAKLCHRSTLISDTVDGAHSSEVEAEDAAPASGCYVTPARSAEGADDSLSGNPSNRQAFRGPQAPVFDGIPMSTVWVDGIDDTVTAHLTVLCCFPSHLAPALAERASWYTFFWEIRPTGKHFASLKRLFLTESP